MTNKKTLSGIKNVFLDTQVYVANNFQYDNSHFKRLSDLVRWNKVKILSTDINVQEVYNNIDKLVDDSKKALESIRSKSRILKNTKGNRYESIFKDFKNDQLKKEFHLQFDNFCKNNKILILSTKKIQVENVIKRYFEKLPPFGPNKKKDEFPDAIILETLINWCKEKSLNVIVISGDEGMYSGCKSEGCLIELKKIEELFEIVVLESFSTTDSIKIKSSAESMLNKNKENIEEKIIEKFEELEFWTNDVDGEIDDIYVSEVYLSEHFLTNYDLNSYIFENTYEISFNVSVSYPDHITMKFEKKDLLRSVEVKAQIVLFFDEEFPQQATGLEVEFTNRDEVEIFVLDGN